MKKHVPKIILLFSSLILIVLISSFVFWFYNYQKIQSGLSYEFGDTAISGGRVEFTLINKRGYPIDKSIIVFSNGEKYELGDDLLYKYDSESSQDKLDFFFLVEIEGESYRYPEKDYLNIDLEEASDTDPEIIHEAISYTDLEEVLGSNIELGFQIQDSFPTDNIFLEYSINSLESRREEILFNEDGYWLEVDLPPRLSKFEYQFKFSVGEKELVYPEQTTVIVNEEFINFRKTIIDAATKSKNNLLFTLEDDFGNVVSYKGGEDIVALSTIKVLVMVEVYNQLDQGKINWNDKVSRYGYNGTVKLALGEMMHRSNNEATGALIRHVGGVDMINNTISEYLGADIKTYIDHTPAYAGIGNERFEQFNIVTTDELNKLVKLISEGKVVSEESSKLMIELMEECQDYFNVLSIEGLEKISMKTGYYPPLSFGLTGVVSLESEKYYFTVYLDNYESGKFTKTSEIKDVVEQFHNFITNN